MWQDLDIHDPLKGVVGQDLKFEASLYIVRCSAREGLTACYTQLGHHFLVDG